MYVATGLGRLSGSVNKWLNIVFIVDTNSPFSIYL